MAANHADEQRVAVFGVSAGPVVTPLNIHAQGIVEAVRMRDDS
jgi:hypothetical protein